MKLYRLYVKRMFDITVGIILFIASFPVFIVILFILLFTEKGKPFFIQKRPGKNEIIFNIIKFRTMREISKDSESQNIKKSKLTPFGAFLRKYSLDEIPQLLNVIKGDMSIIGPRPLLVNYLALYTDEQRKRHLIRPGITGWAQINGRNNISWKRKFELDIWYVDNYSFILDIKIFFITIYKVLLVDGVYNSDNQIVGDFNGTN